MSRSVWQKSTFSTGDGENCVEVAADAGVARLRESDDPHRVVVTTPAALAAFLRAARAGAFDRLGL